MTDHSGMRLGKLPKREIAGLKPLRRYMAMSGNKILPPIPTWCDRSDVVASWPMLDNDQIGDCTIAAVGHAIQLWYGATNRPTAGVMTADEAIQAYSQVSGYQPGNPDTDHGCAAADVLTRWCSQGFESGGSPDVLSGFCALEVKEPTDIRAAIAWLGVAYTGIELPIAAQTMDLWSAPPDTLDGDYAPGSWGGHCVPIIGYDARTLTCVTWGALKTMTWGFWSAYGSEAYGLLSRDFCGAPIDWPRLEADMTDLKEIV